MNLSYIIGIVFYNIVTEIDLNFIVQSPITRIGNKFLCVEISILKILKKATPFYRM